ncbi:MAG: aspartyl protease family protein [Pseudomonadota bacterium]
MKLTTTFVVSVFCLLTSAIAAAQSGVTPWVDIEIDNGLIFIDCEINGIKGKAMLDTGAEIHGINPAFLKKHDLKFKRGRKVKISGVFGVEDRKSYTKVPVKMFGVEVNLRDPVETNLGESGEVQMLIGAGFFHQFVVQFDYPNSRMRLYTRDAVNMKKYANIKTRKEDRFGAPLVKVNMNDEKDLWLTMDTGSNGGVLTERLIAEKAGWLDDYPGREEVHYGVNDSEQMWTFNVPKMTFGPFDLENAIVTVPAKGKKLELFKKEKSLGTLIAHGDSKSQGLLGFDVLKHFVITIDYRTGKVNINVPEA